MAVWAIDMFFDAVCIENKPVVIYGLSPDVQIIFIHNLLFLYDFICILYFGAEPMILLYNVMIFSALMLEITL